MKYTPTLLLGRALKVACIGIALGMAFGGTAVAEEVFEGRVKMKMSDGSEEQSVDYFVKGEKMRVTLNDPRAQGGAMILDMKEKEILMLVPEQKMYMTMPLPDVPGEESEENKPEPTGKTRSILGHTAKQYLVKDGSTEYEVWATEELGRFAGLHLPGDNGPGSASPADRALAGQRFFPLLIIERENGREGSRIEVTEVERKELEDTLFEPPSDFRGMDVPFQVPQ